MARRRTIDVFDTSNATQRAESELNAVNGIYNVSIKQGSSTIEVLLDEDMRDDELVAAIYNVGYQIIV